MTTRATIRRLRCAAVVLCLGLAPALASAQATGPGTPSNDAKALAHPALPPGPPPGVGTPEVKPPEQITVQGRRRAPVPNLPPPVGSSPRNSFNVGGDLQKLPKNCPQALTTVAGQPATTAEQMTPLGVKSCYY